MSEMVRRSAHATYCDDVRQEIGNKISLIGVYTSSLIVPKLPFTLPKLCIVLNVRTSASEPFGEMKFEILKNKDVMVASGILSPPTEAQKSILEMAPSEYVDDSPRVITAQLVMQLTPFQIDEGFLLRTLVTVDGEVLRAGGLIVQQQLETQQTKPFAS